MKKRGFENSISLLRSLKKKSPQSKEELYRDTKIGRQHIKRHLERLEKKGLVKIKDAEKGHKQEASIVAEKDFEINNLISFFE